MWGVSLVVVGRPTRTVVLRSGVQTVPVVLDLVPVAVSGTGAMYQLTPGEVVVAFDGS